MQFDAPSGTRDEDDVVHEDEDEGDEVHEGDEDDEM